MKRFFALALAMLAVSTLQAGLVTSVSEFPEGAGTTVIDFSEFSGPFLFTAGPVQIGDPAARDIEWFSTASNSVIGNGSYGLSTNGSWTSGRNGYTGLNTSSGSMTFRFNDSPVAGVGGFMNYAPGTAATAIIEALDQAGEILESYDLIALAPISTPGGVDAGAFRGIVRAQADIYALRVSNAFDVLDDFTFTEEVGAARFKVTKTFTNGDTGDVEVTLTCNGGLPLQQSFMISGGGPGVTFTVTNLPDTGADCEVTETGGNEGYTADLSACAWTAVTGGLRTCAIENVPEATTLTVETTIDTDGDITIDDTFTTTLTCDDVSPNSGADDFGTYSATDTSGELMVDWYAAPGETAECTVTLVPNGSAVEGATCSFSFELGDEEAGCDVEGTVFFEGIPTLSQYGMAIMVLLMLGVGFVGMRRFV